MGKRIEKQIAKLLRLVALGSVLFATAAACGKAAGTDQKTVSSTPTMISSVNSEANKMELWGGGDVKPGNWGGPGISMVVEKSSATIEFDCADATISSRMKTDKSGKFTATGLLTRAGPGPIRLGVTPKAQQVRFEGKVTGKMMTMTVKFVESGEVIGKYSLEQDKPAKLRRCL